MERNLASYHRYSSTFHLTKQRRLSYLSVLIIAQDFGGGLGLILR